MDRKDFLIRMAQTGTGLCWCAAVAGQITGNIPATDGDDSGITGETDWIEEMERRMKEGAATPEGEKMRFAGEWLQRLLANMDNLMTEEVRKNLMQSCGRSCFINAFGVASTEPPEPGCLDNFLRGYQDRGETEVRREGNTVYFQYGSSEQNSHGLRLLDGYCMCPLVESGPSILSPTYCQCSAGYVKELFDRMTGQSVQVKVLESLRTGGKLCRFRIELPG